jgi:hypothetical protein
MSATAAHECSIKGGFSATQHSNNLETSFAPERQADDTPQRDTTQYGWRFWMIILSLYFTSLLTGIEATVTTTALPSIARELNSRELYVWFVNALFLSRLVPPLRLQICRLLHRTNTTSALSYSPCLDNWPMSSVAGGLPYSQSPCLRLTSV